MQNLFKISMPFSLKEIFDRQAHARAKELRAIALEAWDGNKDAAWDYISNPRTGWGDERPLYDQSLASDESHKAAVNAIRQMQYGVYV